MDLVFVMVVKAAVDQHSMMTFYLSPVSLYQRQALILPMRYTVCTIRLPHSVSTLYSSSGGLLRKYATAVGCLESMQLQCASWKADTEWGERIVVTYPVGIIFCSGVSLVAR